jgi:hypothetical protein
MNHTGLDYKKDQSCSDVMRMPDYVLNLPLSGLENSI